MNDFNRIAKSPLEEWIYYLNTGDIPDNTTISDITGLAIEKIEEL